MRRYSANYIFPISHPPIKNGIIEVDDNGVILRIINPGIEFKEIHSTEFHNGVIVPGFVNAHCHLELSHLLGQFPKGLGIAGFIKAVSETRLSDPNAVSNAISRAIKEIELTGTVAVGDICNTTETINAKSKSRIHFHNFIEVFGINPSNADKIFENTLRVKREFKHHFPNSSSVTPHSTYSLSENLWSIISDEIQSSGLPVSIHFAESLPEYEFLNNGTGAILDRYNLLDVPFDKPNGLTPSKVIYNHINPNKEIILIHNTFASIDELSKISKHYRKATFVTCPESNLYIEGNLPELAAMYSAGLRIAVGTDSLASATTFSMLHHINLLLNNFKEIPFADILKWATLNGAEALNIDSRFGSIEVGKAPGLNLISNFDFNSMKPHINSSVKRLV